MSGAADLLGPQGPLARRMPGYEARSGQLEMAAAVERALESERVLLCEAGTGTGKTLAYLVPAIQSGKTVVVSTATRALQHQIFDKDLPLIAEVLGLEPQAAMMKGLGNYACRRRYSSFRRSGEAVRPRLAASLAVVESWMSATETGDLGELSALAEDDPVLEAVASSSDTRVGAACPFYEECFVTRMKRDAESARLVVVNHHLFFADLALRGPHPGRVIPDYDAVIFDEAHQLEDIATAFFSVSVSTSRIARLLKELGRALTLSGHGDPLLSRGGTGPALLVDAERAQRSFFDVVGAEARFGEGRARLERDVWAGACQEAYHRLDTALEGLAALAETSKSAIEVRGPGPKQREAWAVSEAFELAQRRCGQLRTDLATIVEGAPGRVTWIETGRRSTVVSSSPIDVADVFRERVFERIPSVVLTSATLVSGRSGKQEPFSFIRRRLGIDDQETGVSELVVASPFSFEENTLLYVPDDLPPPSHSTFGDRAAARIADLVAITGGGAFVLTTSLRAMRRLHRDLQARLGGRTVLVQGSAPKATLLGAFRSGEDAVLVATMSFWQGVDVPGRALRLVVLDKVPFPVPSDPIVDARARALEAEGRNPFLDLFVPVAKIVLKQGFGRLIRTRSDYGIVALLDDRVYQKSYGRKLLDALPPAARARSLDEVREFWRAHSVG